MEFSARSFSKTRSSGSEQRLTAMCTATTEDVTDSIFFYVKSDSYTWNQLYRKVDDVEAAFPNVDSNGRRWRSENMRNPGVRPNLHYPYTASNGITYQPHPNGWTVSLEKMQKLDAEGRLHFPSKPGGDFG